MKFERLIKIVDGEPVFEAGLLLAGDVDPADVRRQLSRWTKGGRLYQLRRGLYALAPPFQKVRPHPFLIANRMVRSSYVSCQSALAYYDLIPEHVPVITSVTTMRPHRGGLVVYPHPQVQDIPAVIPLGSGRKPPIPQYAEQLDAYCGRRVGRSYEQDQW